MRTWLPFLLIIPTGCTSKGGLSPKPAFTVMRSPSTVQLTETLSTGIEITRANGFKGRAPTVILVHDRGPQDMDGFRTTPYGSITPHKQLADALSERGFTVVRYHKRHVTGPESFDLPAFIGDEDTHTFRDDLIAVTKEVRQRDGIDPERVFYVGIGEGTMVAAAAAATTHPKGIAFIGPVGRSYPENVTAWWTDQTLPLLNSFAYEGRLDGRLLGRAMNAATSPPVQETARLLAVSYTRGATVVRPSPLVDRNRDGILSLADEVVPAVERLVSLTFSPLGNLQMYTPDKAVPTVTEQVPSLLETPLLVLQGGRDSHMPKENVEAIEQAFASTGHSDAQIQRFPDLGHTLGEAQSLPDDVGRTMEPQPIQALADWLIAHVR